jgi:hypothetical protein
MSIDNALAGIAVKDLQAGMAWYQQLIGRPADTRPMPEVAEWKFPAGGWIQLFEDGARAGHSSLTLAVSGLHDHVRALRSKGVPVGDPFGSKRVKVAMVKDPDGNRVVLAEAFTADMAQ